MTKAWAGMVQSLHLRNVYFVSLVVLLMSACAHTPKQGWGGQVDLSPGWEKFKRAAINAAKDPGTWLPAGGAILVRLSGRDEEWTQDAIRESWLYDSLKDAAETSDEHARTLDKMWMASMAMTSSGEDEYWSNKTEGIVAEVLIVNTSIVTTNALKKAIRRRPPEGGFTHESYEGFPSNHSTPPFTQVALIRRNMRYVPVNDFLKYSYITASYLLASSSAYGRVEAGLHHVSDQMAGAALGNYIGLLLFDSFVEDESMWSMTIYPTMDNDGAMVQFSSLF